MNVILCMRFNKFLLMSTLFTLIFTGCARIPQFTDQPFRIGQDEFYRTIKVIALEPLVMPEMKQAGDVRTEFESLLTEKLKQAGLTVVPSDKYDALLKPLIKQGGGLYDPITGKKNKDKLEEIREKIFDELRAQYQIDAVARVTVMPTAAYFRNCTAQWDGVAQDIKPCGFFGANYSGKISAISLLVNIHDKEEKYLFLNAGGIQLTARIETGFLQSPQFIPIAIEDLLIDKLKNQSAIDIALAPLIPKQK